MNLNVYTVVIKFYRNYVTNLLSFLQVKKFWKFLRGGGVIKDPPGTKNPGGRWGANQKVFRGGGMDIFWNHTI